MDFKQKYIKGNQAFSSCDYKVALKNYLPIYEKFSTDEVLILRISQCYQELDMFDEAIEFLENLLDLNIKQKKYKKAIAVCKRILSIDPDDTEIVLKLANILRMINQPSDAARYYRIAARHYEYAGFLDKSLDILLIIKELEQYNVDDMLELVKKEYERGAKASADKNIYAIIFELKKGKEYGLLDIALNLALCNSSYNLENILNLIKLSFDSKRHWKCLKLCLWGLKNNPDSSALWGYIVKSLLVLGYQELAKDLAKNISNKNIPIETDEAKLRFRKIYDFILQIEADTVKSLQHEEKTLSDENIDFSYLDNENFTQIIHEDIEQDVLKNELKQIIDTATEEKTVILDLKRQLKLKPHVLEKVKEAEILIAEGIYDKAASVLIKISEEAPGNELIKNLLDKVMHLDRVHDHSRLYVTADDDFISTEKMIMDLENSLKEDVSNVDAPSTLRLDKIIKEFSDEIDKNINNQDYETLFELGIAYMELELWHEAKYTFEKIISFLSSSNIDTLRLLESKMYFAVSLSQIGNVNESIEILKGILSNKLERTQNLDVLYNLGLCYEKLGNIKDAKDIYKDIQIISPTYRDIEIRCALIGNK